MKHRSGLLLFLILSGFSIFSANIYGAAEPDSLFAGTWAGKLSFGNTSLRIVIHITGNSSVGYQAKLDSPDQGAAGIVADRVQVSGDTITVGINIISATVSGVLSADKQSINAGLKQNGANLTLLLTRAVAEEVKMKRPQTPVGPFPYSELPVTFSNPKANAVLSGTLTIPSNAQAVAAVVMVTGSGPQNRDEELFGHKPFAVIADYLTRHGIAVLRYDDRGTAKSTGNFAQATSFDFADDANAAVEFLKTQKGIDPKRIGIIGHSEGGIIAPIAATNNPDVAFIVLMAGPGINGEEIVLQQSALISQVSGTSQEEINKQDYLMRETFGILKSTADSAEALAKFTTFAEKYRGTLPDSVKERTENAFSTMKRQFDMTNTAWFRLFLVHDPAAVLEKVKCPVLAVIGAKDLQVPPATNLPVIRKAVTQSGNRLSKVIELPDLNHLFQHCKSGSPAEYGQIEETTAPELLETIQSFIQSVH